jgi:hypothetical protein
VTVKGLDLPVPRDILQSPEADAKMGAFEMAVSLLKETSSLIKNVPYLGVIAGVFLELARIKGVRLCLFYPILSETESCDVCTGGRPLSRILGGGHVQRHQSRRSREALWRSMPAPRAVRRGDVPPELRRHHKGTRNVTADIFDFRRIANFYFFVVSWFK